jgi:hypothetical protein
MPDYRLAGEDAVNARFTHPEWISQGARTYRGHDPTKLTTNRLLYAGNGNGHRKARKSSQLRQGLSQMT